MIAEIVVLLGWHFEFRQQAGKRSGGPFEISPASIGLRHWVIMGTDKVK
jgi:hypothetical protein